MGERLDVGTGDENGRFGTGKHDPGNLRVARDAIDGGFEFSQCGGIEDIH